MWHVTWLSIHGTHVTLGSGQRVAISSRNHFTCLSNKYWKITQKAGKAYIAAIVYFMFSNNTYMFVHVNHLYMLAWVSDSVVWACVFVCERESERGRLTDCQPIIHPYTNLSCRSSTTCLWFLVSSLLPFFLLSFSLSLHLSMKQIQYTVTLSGPRLAIWILSRSQKGTHRAKLIFLLR